jgi:hypothetical protein
MYIVHQHYYNSQFNFFDVVNDGYLYSFWVEGKGIGYIGRLMKEKRGIGKAGRGALIQVVGLRRIWKKNMFRYRTLIIRKG